MLRVPYLVLMVSALLVTGVFRSMAQEATPATGVVPDPSECQVAPRDANEVVALWARASNIGTPISEAADVDDATPELSEFGTPQAVIIDIPVGDPADAETMDAITATVRELFACVNAGDFLRATALYSDDFVRRIAPDPSVSQEEIDSFLATEAAPLPENERLVLIAVTNVTVTDDGRVAAIVVSNDPAVDGPGGTETSLVYFVERDGRWTLDESIGGAVGDADREGGNIEATPAL